VSSRLTAGPKDWMSYTAPKHVSNRHPRLAAQCIRPHAELNDTAVGNFEGDLELLARQFSTRT
jgi:hypothetical protein